MLRVPLSTALLLALLSTGCSSGGAGPSAPAADAGPDESRFTDVSEAQLPFTQGATMEGRAADLDGDGDLDLLLAKEHLPNALLLNDGRGRFTDATEGRIAPANHDSEDIALADLDGDGDLDALICTEDDAVQELHLNDGTARFREEGEARLGGLRNVTNAVLSVDLDGDGDQDLLLGGRGPERALLNDGAGRFRDDSAARLPARGDTTQDLAWGDLDGDGDADLAVGNEDGNRLLLNDGTGHFTDATSGRLPPANEETRNVELGDVDRDGDLDLLFANVNLGTGRLPQDRLLLNDGAGHFTDATAERLPPEGAQTMDSDLVDLDGDGDLDAVQALLQGSRGGRVWLNDGSGRFADVSGVFLPETLRGDFIEVEVADYDGDGRLDLFFGAFTGGRDRLLLAR
jgi:hypothetical protein